MIHEKGKLIMHIQANYDHILQEGQNLQQQAQDCRSRIRQLAATMEQTAEIWQGEDCQTFLSQARCLQPHLIRLTEIMSQYGDTLIRTAQTYRQLQQDRAAQAARLL